MNIFGLQKMTLLDFPGKVACTVFLGGCNFRCPFCHNFELLGAEAQPVMDDEKLLAFLKQRQGLLDGVCITGGEPTLQPGLPQLLERIKVLGYPVKLDTNGYRPDVLRSLVENKLVDYVAMDIKNGPRQYAATAGLPALKLERIEESIRFLLEGTVDYEFRTTVVDPLHDEASITAMAQWLEDISRGIKARRFFLQPFVDRDTVPFSNFASPKPHQLQRYLGILSTFAEQIQLRGT